MSPIGPPHASTVELLTEPLVLALAGRARVRVQTSFAASELSEPEPDLRDRVVDVYREPASDGYRQLTTIPKGARLPLLSFPDVALAVDDFLH